MPKDLSAWLAGALYFLIWLVIIGPVLTLLVHLASASTSTSTSGSYSGFSISGALYVSLASSGLALLVVVGLGTCLAWAMARRRVPGSGFIRFTLLVPLLMPPLVIGLLLAYMLGPRSIIGEAISHLHLSATNTFLALVLAEIYESIPYFVLGAEAAFRSVDPELEQAAALLGDPPGTVFRRITLPNAAPGLASSLSFAWARAMGAFGAVVVIAYNPHNLPVAIWIALQDQGLGAALLLAALLLIVALPVPLGIFAWSLRRSKFRINPLPRRSPQPPSTRRIIP